MRPLKAAGQAARAALFRRPALLECPALGQGFGQSAQASSAARRVRTASALTNEYLKRKGWTWLALIARPVEWHLTSC